jgi:CheY-like chemotaxis protein
LRPYFYAKADVRNGHVILLVDDEEEVTDLMTQVLDRLGYQSLAVNGPFQALVLLSDAPE